ncbi:RagB/SusD family nutrient uptake outer membrane protein [Mangrovibacterium lignilyticum]|uniref:RagB/SusD family nutrient uptake outer membrane protein n=1 Tax=Mangrovibacterium lignilyticum TaxID=2668052 RepID=UPI0013D19AA4|nr:RagB/SusD family nutrient uptake outer membrane protein [Mangrovibacterium lignilyticum]
MKLKYFPTIILFILILSSCSDSFLDESDPNQITTTEFWKSAGDIESALATGYNAITDDYNGHYGTVNWQLMESKTENFIERNDVRARYEISVFQNTFSNDYAANLYKGAYVGIFRANQIIQYGGAIEGIDTNEQNKLLAEAYFLRGLNYFFLVTDFGAVPVTTAVAESSGDYFKEKSSMEQVWNQTIKDFKAGAEYLPNTRESAEKGRATRGAALAYLGRSYLYQADYDSTIIMLEQIVDNEDDFGYGLQQNYAELFDGQHENGVEGVFEIQYSNIGGTSIWAGNEVDKPQTTFIAQECAPGEVGGWFEMQPSKVLRDSFLVEPTADGEVDPRALATIAWDYPGSMYYQLDFGATFGDEVWLRKNQNWWDANEGEWKSELNEYGIRYADVLLMLAEAYTMTGDVAGAAPLVHRIRERANLSNKLSEMTQYSQDEMMQEIRRQRNLEFAREGLHFYDLRRWGLLESTIKNAQQLGYQNYTSKFEYYPIPENELNNNPNMTQSDVWK